MASNNQGGNKQSGTGNRGFASMDPERQREIASEGGRAAHAKGTAHEFTSEEARRAGSMSHGGNQQSGNRSGNQQGANQAGNQQSGSRSGSQQGSNQGGNQQSGSRSGNQQSGNQGGSQSDGRSGNQQSGNRGNKSGSSSGNR